MEQTGPDGNTRGKTESGLVRQCQTGSEGVRVKTVKLGEMGLNRVKMGKWGQTGSNGVKCGQRGSNRNRQGQSVTHRIRLSQIWPNNVRQV